MPKSSLTTTFGTFFIFEKLKALERIYLRVPYMYIICAHFVEAIGQVASDCCGGNFLFLNLKTYPFESQLE